MPELAQNLALLRERLARAAARARRDPAAVTLVAVTKGCGLDVVRDLYELGLRDFGENRVQEALPKMDLDLLGARWHLIGPLQENKINKVLRRVAMVQSIDTVALARAIDRRAAGQGVRLPVLLEVKTSPEPAKHGVAPEAACDAYREIATLPGLEPKGLMTIAPFGATEPELRRSFAALRRLGEQLRDAGCEMLSMGMSDDFEIAVEEGSTLVRIGRALVKG
jgi:pyridoxal phosphate enzyme (YggS family)